MLGLQVWKGDHAKVWERYKEKVQPKSTDVLHKRMKIKDEGKENEKPDEKH